MSVTERTIPALDGEARRSNGRGRRSGAQVQRLEPSKAELDPARYERRRKALEIALAIGVPAALILLWQVASSSGWIDRRFYPSPSDIVTSEAFRSSDVWADVWVSTRRMIYGFLAGSSVGVLLGFLMGVSRNLRAALESLLSALYTVPKLALIPIFIMIFGLGEKPIIALIGVTVFFFVWIATMAAVMSVPEGYREAAQAFRVSRLQLFRHVLLPGALPSIFVGLRIAAGVSVLILIGVELVMSQDGIGFMIEQGRQLFLPEQTYAGIVLSALLGLVFMWVVRLVGRVLLPWAPEDKGVA
jgi:sulfonate transport system permease protein